MISDTEMLDWLIGKMDEGVCTYGQHEWFLDGKQITNEDVHQLLGGKSFGSSPEVDRLEAEGRLQLRQVGYSVNINCGVEWSDFAGAGATVREAIEAAMKKEKEDGITTE